MKISRTPAEAFSVKDPSQSLKYSQDQDDILISQDHDDASLGLKNSQDVDVTRQILFS
jgi:hypothetical protein